MDSPATPTSPTNRPHSRAHSDASFATATERAHSPHSPRALAHEIDHIKTLISRSQHHPPATGSITAQVFQRNRSSSNEPVSQARIFHELDVLKRRVRHVRDGSYGEDEASTGVFRRKDSEVDPGVETESEEGGDVGQLDEREEELEWARQELERVKREREEWLEDAERRVDVLISEKENLSGKLDGAEGRVRELEGVREGLAREREEKEALCRKIEEVQAEMKEVQVQIDSLRKEKEVSAKSLKEAEERISALEENNRASGEHVQRLMSERKTRDSEAESKYNDLEELHNKAQQESQTAASKIEVLEKAAQVHELDRSELVKQLDQQTSFLSGAKSDLETLAQEHEEARQAIKESRREREEIEGNCAAARRELDNVREDLKAVENGREEDKANLDKAHDEIGRLSRLNEEQQSALQAELEKSKADSASLREERDRHRRDLDSLSAERNELSRTAEQKQNALQEEHAKQQAILKGDLDDLQAKHASEIAELRAERDRFATDADSAQTQALQDAEKKHESLKEEHEKAIAELRERHDAEMQRLREEHETQAEKTGFEHSEAIETAQTELKEARGLHERETEQLRAKHEGWSRDLERSHQAATEEQQSNHQRALEAARDELSEARKGHDKAVTVLKQSHETALSEQRSQHQEALDDVLAQLSQAGSSHEKNVAQLGQQHQDAITALREELLQAQEALTAAEAGANSSRSGQQAALDEAVGQLAEAEDSHEKNLAELGRTHQEAISALREELVQAQESLTSAKKTSDEETSRLREEHDRKLSVVKNNHESTLTALKETEMAVLRDAGEKSKAENDEVLSRMRREHDEATAKAEVEFEERVSNIQIEHEDTLAGVKREHQLALNQQRQEHERAREEVDREHDAQMQELTVKVDGLNNAVDELKSQHRAALDGLYMEREQTATGHARVLADMEVQLHQARSEHAAEMVRIQDDHARDLDAVRNDPAVQEQQGEVEALRTQLDKLKAEQKMAMSEKDAELGSQISALRYEHSKALSEVQSQHQTALQQLRNASETEVAALKHTHEETLARSKAAARRETEDRIARLEDQHEASLRAALAHADDDLDERLRYQAAAHGEEIDHIHSSLNDELQHLQTQLEEASELRTTQMAAADAQNKGALTELGDKLRMAEQASADLAAKHVQVVAELSALQARLEAESTGHAEAERALAVMRKQRFEEEKRLVGGEGGEELVRRVDELTAERDVLRKQVEGAGLAAGVDSDGRAIAAADGAKDVSGDGDEDVASLQNRLAAMKLESQRQADEMARQNEFLVKELEAMRMHVNTPTAAGASPAQQSDAGSQTEPEPPQPTSTRERVVIPPTMPEQVNGASERPSTARSFEDYLQQAKAELSELGSVITANEALFAQKIQEHVGSLQLAKDQLAAEYKSRFDALLLDKERMDKDVHSTSAEEFARDRQQLAATYGVEKHEHEAALPTPQKKAFRSAEEQLVKEYNRRIAKKKSKIALKHAEEFQILTKDYDAQIAELLSNKERLEGDLSVDPEGFERRWDEMDARGLQLEIKRDQESGAKPPVNGATVDNDGDDKDAEGPVSSSPDSPLAAPPGAPVSTADPNTIAPAASTSKSERRRSGLPRLTSAPRTPTSIPRAVPFPGNRDSPDATSQPMMPRTPYDHHQQQHGSRVASERYPPVAQRSLMRAKFPVEGGGGGGERRSVTGPATRDGGSTREERDEVGEVGLGKLENKGKRRGLRHSSGMLFANWREQHQG